MRAKRARGYRGNRLRPIGVGQFYVAPSASISAPTGLAALAGQSGSNPCADLTWDNAAGVTWKIEKSTNGGSSYSQIDTSVINSYTDTTFAADSTSIRYRVKATDGVNTSAASNQAGAVLITTAGIGTWSTPTGATTAQFVCVGAGANGQGGDGGGGGALSILAVSSPSGDYTTNVGDTSSGYASYLKNGGGATIAYAETAINATGASASNGVGDTKHSGGNGNASGTGGGAAGKTGDGANGGGVNGGAAGSGGTLSGAGGNIGQTGSKYGGGGADGFAGAVGSIAISFVLA